MIFAALLSPVGRAVGVVAIALAVTWGIYNAGQRSERAKCDAAAVRVELASVRADLNAAKRAAENAAALQQMLTDADRHNQEIADEARTADACPIGEHDLGRLLRLR